jgi:hypothetical protein
VANGEHDSIFTNTQRVVTYRPDTQQDSEPAAANNSVAETIQPLPLYDPCDSDTSTLSPQPRSPLPPLSDLEDDDGANGNEEDAQPAAQPDTPNAIEDEAQVVENGNDGKSE